jgi:hypothetical protein
VFAFILSEGQNFPTEELSGADVLKYLTLTTGGAIIESDGSLSAKDHDRINNALAHGYDEMARFYEVEVELPSSLKKESRWTLEIVDERGKKRKDLQAFYPQEQPACSLMSNE